LRKPPLGGVIVDMNDTTTPTQPQLSKLATFRQAIYTCFLKAGEVLFELIDALLLSPRLASFPELSCVPVFRRQWPSLYEGLQDGKVDETKLLETLTEQLPESERPLLVGDHTAWPHPQARTLQDRSFQHQPTPIKGQKPITLGHGYSTLGVVPTAAKAGPQEAEQKSAGSWFLPLLHERIESDTTPSNKAAEQLKQVCQKLEQRPLALYESEYGSGTFLTETDGIPCDLLFRVRSNRKLRRPPPPYKGRGARPKHGPLFRLGDPTTWGKADEEWEFTDPKLGRVCLQRWNTLHFEEAPTRLVTLFRIERLEARGTRRDPHVVWLGYCGEELPRHSLEWRQYLNRFVIEHWYRFIKQGLSWTLPRLGTPQQSELWSLLVIIAYWQLWLAQGVVADCPRPWQKSQPQLTPGRVHQAMGGIFATIGTPAGEPKPRGNSPGWPPGRVRTKRTRCPLVKKQTKATVNTGKQAATTYTSSP
jgi:hypothetical protein